MPNATAAPGFHWTIAQGATAVLNVTYKDSAGVVIDLTGYTARLKVKQSVADTTALVDATTANGLIAITALSGIVALTLTAAVTAALDFTTGVFDLEIISGAGVVTRLLQGPVTLDKEVTK